MQHIFIEPRLRRRDHSGETQDQNHIPTHPMILVHTLRPIHTAIQPGSIILRQADQGLQRKQDVRDEAEDGVRGFEMGTVVADFVVFDYDEGGEEGEGGEGVEGAVDAGADGFLARGVRGLED